jgi:hypothetical protein
MRSKPFLALGLMVLVLSPPALAGYTQPAAVTVDLEQNIAAGDMATARYAKGQVAFIGCGLRSFEDGEGGTITFGFCQASDANGVAAACFTENPELLKVMAASDDFSWISFGWVGDDDEDGTCTRIGSSTQSFYLPKGLKPNKGTPVDDD